MFLRRSRTVHKHVYLWCTTDKLHWIVLLFPTDLCQVDIWLLPLAETVNFYETSIRFQECVFLKYFLAELIYSYGDLNNLEWISPYVRTDRLERRIFQWYNSYLASFVSHESWKESRDSRQPVFRNKESRKVCDRRNALEGDKEATAEQKDTRGPDAVSNYATETLPDPKPIEGDPSGQNHEIPRLDWLSEVPPIWTLNVVNGPGSRTPAAPGI